MLCQFQVDSKVIQLYISIRSPFISHVHLLSVTRSPNVFLPFCRWGVNFVYQASCNLERFSVLQSRLRMVFMIWGCLPCGDQGWALCSLHTTVAFPIPPHPPTLPGLRTCLFSLIRVGHGCGLATPAWRHPGKSPLIRLENRSSWS